ncbi:hypothetical protein ASG32_08305 [Methylobacterium sp. Leaf361]|uniref:hypothetical protein n=1 Tax=Methylobacterium sp. Leaf361 TaxID=1736352 RepID=UPI0006F66408|nr:hypothetical protein [Methylobacterium sp. Leaf361]KQS75090.1 hypothetical protein ASG32_08305 [Methylobacterium sp. Leaf361]
MRQIITDDGTVIRNGVSRPFRPRDAGTRRAPPTSVDPRERDPHSDPQDRSFLAFRAFARQL